MKVDPVFPSFAHCASEESAIDSRILKLDGSAPVGTLKLENPGEENEVALNVERNESHRACQIPAELLCCVKRY